MTRPAQTTNSHTNDLYHNTRAVSTTIGFILIISIVVISTGIVLGLGVGVLSETQTTAAEHSTDATMTQFDTQASLVAFDGSTKQTVPLTATSTEQITIEDTGSITVDIVESDGGSPTTAPVTDRVLDRDLHAVTYQSDNRRVAYQGGGVWSMRNTDPDTAEMISAPEFSYEGDTATLPIIGIAENPGFTSSDGDVTIERNSSTGVFPAAGNDTLQNPVSEEHDVLVTIESPYYQAWGVYFENRLGMDVQYNHSANTVVAVFVGETEDRRVSTALTSTAGDTRVTLTGQGIGTIVDSYNSTEGVYVDSYGQNGDVHAVHGITHSNGVIRGDVITEGDYTMRGNAEVTGNASVNGSVQQRGGSTIHGSVTGNASVTRHDPIDRVIESVRTQLSDDNDNQDADAVTGGEITSDREFVTHGTPTTIEAGDFYVQDISTRADLTFDVTDGDIRVVTDSSIDFSDATVNVTGTTGNDHRVEVYTRGDAVELSTVKVTGDRAPAMWFYAGAGTKVDVYESVTGVLYAPGTREIPGDVTVHSQADLFGATVGGNTEIENQAAYHYDEAVGDTVVFTDPVHAAEATVDVSYFHISYTELEVTS